MTVAEDTEDVLDLPVLAVVGRPNVGKSTLVNRILGRREAVVQDVPGVTRDRVAYDAQWSGRRFTVVDTGGWEPDAKGFQARVAAQADQAMRTADAVLLVVDASVGATATDEAVARLLRRGGKPVVLAANKVDDERAEPEAASLWSLGLGEPRAVSALHGRGAGELLDAILEALPEAPPDRDDAEGGPRRVALVGRPNVGKSSLLNRLAGEERAIVTPIPGTTRDIVRERIDIDGMPLHVLDTAGLRDTADEVETEGIRRAEAEIARADRVLFVIDAETDYAATAFSQEKKRLPTNVPVTLIFNKCDLAVGIPVADTITGPPRVMISALTGDGLDMLREHLKHAMGFHTADSGTVSARQRHLDALARARQHVEEGERQLKERRAGELVAEELRAAQTALGEITGEFTTDDLLGRIFSSFCIGK